MPVGGVIRPIPVDERYGWFGAILGTITISALFSTFAGHGNPAIRLQQVWGAEILGAIIGAPLGFLAGALGASPLLRKGSALWVNNIRREPARIWARRDELIICGYIVAAIASYATLRLLAPAKAPVVPRVTAREPQDAMPLGELEYPGSRLEITASTGRWYRLATGDSIQQVKRYYTRLLGAPERTAEGNWLFVRRSDKINEQAHVIVFSFSVRPDTLIEIWWPRPGASSSRA